MKIVIAPDSYKGSLTAMEVADSIEKGILKVVNDPIIEKIPMADGGEGTVQSLVDSTGGKIIYKSVKGPVLKDVNAFLWYSWRWKDCDNRDGGCIWASSYFKRGKRSYENDVLWDRPAYKGCNGQGMYKYNNRTWRKCY